MDHGIHGQVLRAVLSVYSVYSVCSVVDIIGCWGSFVTPTYNALRGTHAPRAMINWCDNISGATSAAGIGLLNR